MAEFGFLVITALLIFAVILVLAPLKLFSIHSCLCSILEELRALRGELAARKVPAP